MGQWQEEETVMIGTENMPAPSEGSFSNFFYETSWRVPLARGEGLKRGDRKDTFLSFLLSFV